jgi:hypothetical protein
MTKYLLTIYTPADVPPPPPEVLGPIMRNVDALTAEAKATGVWVFNGGLHAPSTATVLRAKDGDVLMTDGPYLEGKEYVGGFTIIQVPDLDAALEWGRKYAQVITGLAIEVRPFVDESER